MTEPPEVGLEGRQRRPHRHARAARICALAIGLASAAAIATAASGGRGDDDDDEETGWIRTPDTQLPELITPPSYDRAGLDPASYMADVLRPVRGETTPPTDADRGGSARTTTTSTTTATADEPLVVARPIPEDPPPVEPEPGVPAPPWAASTRPTPEGFIATDLGCAADTTAPALDAFFRERMGPVIGHDYQHVYPLGDDRYLWLFQDTFVDHPGVASRLDQASFVHNSAMVQDGTCFTLYHRGSPDAPESFEPGTGESRLQQWFWPLGGELEDGRLYVFWAEMVKDPDPPPGDGLGWHPVRTWLATYDAETLGAARVPARSQLGRHSHLRIRGGQRRRPHLPVRQHVRPEPVARRRILVAAQADDEDVARPCAAR